MPIAFTHLRPLRVLVDRSRDLSCGYALSRLMPGTTFNVTETRKPISAPMLKGYDLLAIAGVSTLRYSAGEINAIDAFVQRGGSLLLASSAGVIAAGGHALDDLAHGAIAARFGYAFCDSSQLPMSPDGLRGFEREELAFSPAGRELHLEPGDVPVRRPGALAIPDHAQVILSGGREKHPVIAWSQHEQGKVLVCHDIGMFEGWNGFIPAHFISLIDPAERVPADRPLVSHVGVAERRTQHGVIAITTTPSTHTCRERVLAIARRVLPLLDKHLPTREPLKRWTVNIRPGCGGWTGWGEKQFIDSSVGADLGEPQMAAMIIAHAVERRLWAVLGHELRTMVRSLCSYATDKLLRAAGYTVQADELLQALRAHPTSTQRLDFGRVYSEVDTPVSLRCFWFDLDKALGRDWLRRTLKAMPKSDAWKHIDWRLFTELDAMALAIEHGGVEGIHDLLRARGHTVREMPKAKLGSDEFGKAMTALLREMIEQRTELPSDRHDAACILADHLGKEIKDDDKLVMKLSLPGVADRVAAAVYLAQRRDTRSLEPLHTLLRDADPGLAAIAAITLVSECGERRSCDALLAAAREADTRFQLAAGYALLQVDDARGEALSFRRHPACSMKVQGRGQFRANPCVDGYEVCNVYSTALVRPTQFGGGFSTFYVDWVHTSPRWRRRGIARAGMHAGLQSHWDDDCAMTSLHTGVRNFAHALYRDFGLVDHHRAVLFEKSLETVHEVKPPRGVSLAMVQPRDATAFYEFVAQQQAIAPDERRGDAGEWAAERVALVARKAGRIVGAVSGRPSQDGKSAQLELLALADEEAINGKRKPAKNAIPSTMGLREQVAQTLLSRLHGELRRRGARKISSYVGRPTGEQDTTWFLRRAGYGTSAGGGVELYRLNNLHQFLQETVPTFRARLARSKTSSKWSGRISLHAGKQASTLVFDHGRVCVERPHETRAPAEITLRGSLPVIQRVLLGTQSAFEACYQTDLAIEPMLNEPMTQLLDVLFPRLVTEF